MLLKTKKSRSISSFPVSKNTCLSPLSCVFWEHGLCTVHSKILFDRFSQNEACFWKCLPQNFVEKISTVSTLNIYICSNILWLIGDKRELCVGDLCFSELDCLVVNVLQWCVFMEAF